jgi:hypothetical protein
MHPHCSHTVASLLPRISRGNSGRIERPKREQRGKVEAKKTFVPGFAEARPKFWRTPSHFGEGDPGLIINLLLPKVFSSRLPGGANPEILSLAATDEINNFNNNQIKYSWGMPAIEFLPAVAHYSALT